MSDMKELPEGWEVTKLNDIGAIISGGTPSTSISEYWNGEINWISPVDLSGYCDKKIFKGGKSITSLGLAKSSAKLMPQGSVLFSSRAPIGYVAIAGNELCTNQGFKSVIPYKCIHNEFLYYFLKSAKKQAVDLASGTTFKEISSTNFAKLQIPLPPLPEQHRIVAKIEELFSSLDIGIESLKTAQAQLKTYRQAVLNWAFDNLNQEKSLDEIMEYSLIGIVRSNSELVDAPTGTPYIKMNNIDLNGNIDFKNVVYIKIDEKEKEKFILKKGDILINTRNSYELVGKAGIVREENIKAVFNNNLLKIQVKKEYNPLFIAYQLVSPWLRKQMLKEKKATTNVCALYQRDILPLRVKVADDSVQSNIVSEIETRLSVCDKLEESITQSLLQAEGLRQSILKKAFEGKLVPQDPNDEPAGILLERIRAEQALVAAKNATTANGKKGTKGRGRQK